MLINDIVSFEQQSPGFFYKTDNICDFLFTFPEHEASSERGLLQK